MSISHELHGLLNQPTNGARPRSPEERRANLINGLVMGAFFTVILLFGTGNLWLSVNFGLGMFLVIGDILHFGDNELGITAGLLAALCASGAIGSFFGPDIGKITALGVLLIVAPSVHIMDTQPGFGRGGRNFLAICWAIATTIIYFAWFFENFDLQLVN